MQNIPERYLAYLEEYACFLEEVEQIQKKHLEALLSHEIERIERSAEKQQAALMRMKSYEARRVEKQAEAGFPAEMTLAEMLEKTEPDQRRRLSDCLQRFRNATGQIAYLNEKIKQTASTTMRALDFAAPGDPPKDRWYSSDGKMEAAGEAAVFETKI